MRKITSSQRTSIGVDDLGAQSLDEYVDDAQLGETRNAACRVARYSSLNTGHPRKLCYRSNLTRLTAPRVYHPLAVSVLESSCPYSECHCFRFALLTGQAMTRILLYILSWSRCTFKGKMTFARTIPCKYNMFEALHITADDVEAQRNWDQTQVAPVEK